MGDFGIKALFLKVYESLEKGGIFIIESHTWKSYKKNKKMNDWSKNNYGEIKMRPNMFKEYLERIGFKFIMTINQKRNEANEKKFDKPIMIFKK